MKRFTLVSLAALGACLVAPAASAQTQQTLSRGQSVEGRLEATDATDEARDGVRYDDYRLRLRAGERVRLSLESEAFDPVLRIYGLSDLNEPIAENDDYGEGLDSRLNFTAPADGVYVVRATSFGAGEAGAYRLSAEAIAPLPAPLTLSGRETRMTWLSQTGTLSASDPENDGRRFDDYRISLREGEVILVQLDSEAFDATVEIYAAAQRDGGVPLDANDDSGTELNALLGFSAPETGDYVIRVTSFAADATGPYELGVGRTASRGRSR